MSNVSIGIIGLGAMGSLHARNILENSVPGLQLAAVSDFDAKRAEPFGGIPYFSKPEALLASGKVEAVLIATPHYSHTDLGIAALQAGLHVLVEKPISVHKQDAERLIAAHTNPKQIFAAVFNQRTDPYYLAIRQMIQDGTLGQIRRVQWTVTDWFRTGAYYASGGWRATWQGEGGGVLLNQCPHNLDLLCWLFGRPRRVRAFCDFGHYHDIEVEDNVTAYLEFESGARGTFIASTGEAPGTNRLEIAAEMGRVVLEKDRLVFTENEAPMTEYSRTTTAPMTRPQTTEREIPCDGHGGQHKAILANFAAAILHGEPLIAPAAEGLLSLELANAVLLSSAEERTLDFPIDGAAYASWLQHQIVSSKKTAPAGN